MGLAATHDPALVYQVALALGRQLEAGGINWIHSPVLDICSNFNNPEVATRSYSNDYRKIIQYATATLKGFQDSRIIATGKHFLGRGDAETDSHLGLPRVSLSKSQLMESHIKPYAALIQAGLPAIMIAHTAYPQIDPSGEPATVSEPIVNGLLRRELGYDGVVTTDNMLMGGIVGKYGVAEACIRAILAGQDLLLLRSTSPLCEHVFAEILNAVKSGRIPEERLDEANRRVLRVKFEYGLFENGGKVDPARAAEPQNDPAIIALERTAAEKATLVRNERHVLPLDPQTTVLLVEQVHHTQTTFNNSRCHPSLLWEKMLEMAPNVYSVEITDMNERNQQRVMRRVPEADVIVITNYIARRSRQDISPFIRELSKTGKPVIVVTNSPFEFGSPKDLPTVVNIFSANPESLRVAAEIIFGKQSAQGIDPLAS
jgi:beta-N-acetylhexosaminidase